MTQIQEQQQTVDVDFTFTMGILRSMLQLNIGKQLLVEVPNSMLSDSLMRAKSFVLNSIEEFTLETCALPLIKDEDGDEHSIGWLVKKPDDSKLHDVARLLDTLMRIGNEENSEIYDEFLGLVIDAIVNVFYAQTHRKNIHFGKYKALFKLFAEELRADVNREPGQLWLRDGAIWLRSVPPNNPIKISNESTTTG